MTIGLMDSNSFSSLGFIGLWDFRCLKINIYKIKQLKKNTLKIEKNISNKINSKTKWIHIESSPVSITFPFGSQINKFKEIWATRGWTVFPNNRQGVWSTWLASFTPLAIHYSDVIMGAMASQITSVSNVCPTVCSGADDWKHQSSASLAFVRGIHGDRRISLTKGQ